MKFCWTQPASPCSTVSRSAASFTSSRNFLASAGVGAGSAARPQAARISVEQVRAARQVRMRRRYQRQKGKGKREKADVARRRERGAKAVAERSMFNRGRG